MSIFWKPIYIDMITPASKVITVSRCEFDVVFLTVFFQLSSQTDSSFEKYEAAVTNKPSNLVFGEGFFAPLFLSIRWHEDFTASDLNSINKTQMEFNLFTSPMKLHVIDVSSFKEKIIEIIMPLIRLLNLRVQNCSFPKVFFQPFKTFSF